MFKKKLKKRIEVIAAAHESHVKGTDERFKHFGLQCKEIDELKVEVFGLTHKPKYKEGDCVSAFYVIHSTIFFDGFSFPDNKVRYLRYQTIKKCCGVLLNDKGTPTYSYTLQSPIVKELSGVILEEELTPDIMPFEWEVPFINRPTFYPLHPDDCIDPKSHKPELLITDPKPGMHVKLTNGKGLYKDMCGIIADVQNGSITLVLYNGETKYVSVKDIRLLPVQPNCYPDKSNGATDNNK